MEFIPRFGSINKHIEMHSLKIMEFSTLTAPSGEKNAKRSPRVKMLARKQMISVWMFDTMFARVHILGAQFCTCWPPCTQYGLGKRRMKSKEICRENRTLCSSPSRAKGRQLTQDPSVKAGAPGSNQQPQFCVPRCLRINNIYLQVSFSDMVCTFVLPVEFRVKISA